MTAAPGISGIVRQEVQVLNATVQVVWWGTVPGEIVDAFTPYAEWMARYSPRWLQRLVVEYDSNARQNSSLKVSADRAYCRANVVLSPGWLDQDVAARNWDAAHELLHIYHAPVLAFIDQLRAHEWHGNADVTAIRNQQYLHADEQMTEDLARLLTLTLPLAVP
jgi:hypothetical protein